MNHSPFLIYAISASESIIKASLLLLIATFLAFTFRKRWPAVSHFAWVLAFVSILALPIVSAVAPSTNILRIDDAFLSKIGVKERQLAELPPSGPRYVLINPQQPIADPAPAEVGTRLVQMLRIPAWFEVLFLAWLVGFLAVLSRTAYGLNCLRIIRKYGTRKVESDELAEKLDLLGQTAGVRRSWDLRTSMTHELSLPMTWGVIRPTILLPKHAEEWSPSQFEAVMLHELAHVRRFDFLSQIVAEIVCATYWFHPLVWLGARAMRADAELVADEAVLLTGLKPSDYASELMKLAATIGSQKQPFAHVGTLAMNNSKIENRLHSVLKYPVGKRGVSSLQMLTACAAAVVILPVIAGVHIGSQQPVIGGAPAMTMQQDDAKSRLKQVALATMMYAQDWDGDFPYVQNTGSAAAVLYPYAKNTKIFQSPTKGGQFIFNMNVAGVNMQNITAPAETPMWAEILPESALSMFVAYADGHVKWTPVANYKAAAAIRFKRASKMKPLPADWMLKTKKSASQGGTLRVAAMTQSGFEIHRKN